MLPIRDIYLHVRRPVCGYILIAVTVLVFAYQVALGQDVSAWVRTYGLVPAEVAGAWDNQNASRLARAWLSAFTAPFLHAGYLHLFGNLLYLGVFGKRVEASLGHLGFLAAYFGAAMAGAAAHVWANPLDATPMIGASGAIAGLLGLYVLLFPRARITTLFPAVVALTFVELPALIFVGAWAAQQALNGYLVLAEGLGAQDVAWFAHLGGFGFGLMLGGLIRVRRFYLRRSADSLH